MEMSSLDWIQQEYMNVLAVQGDKSFDTVFGHMFLLFGCGIVVWNCNKTKW